MLRAVQQRQSFINNMMRERTPYHLLSQPDKTPEYKPDPTTSLVQNLNT